MATVTSSANYRLALTYLFSSGGSGTAPFAQWLQRTGAQFTNLAGAPASLPTISYGTSGSYATVTDPGGRVWRIAGAQPTAIRRPGASGDTTSVSYAGGRVSAVTRDGVTTNYAWSTSGTTLTATRARYQAPATPPGLGSRPPTRARWSMTATSVRSCSG